MQHHQQHAAVAAHTTWQAQAAPVGNFEVLRSLPTSEVQAVGPFVFLDHFGPGPARAETLPAHPHAGIEVMTVLLEGGNEHRDSMGHKGTVKAGGAQWMSAGSGILHAETVLPELGATVHGLQLWARLPLALQEAEPAYRSVGAEDVPQWQHEGCTMRLLCGSLQGRVGPIQLALPALMLHLSLPPGVRLSLAPLDVDFEYGVYGIQAHAGNLQLDESTPLVRGSFALLAAGASQIQLHHSVAAEDSAEVFVLGGARAPRPLVFGGPFVLDSRAALTRAHQRYANGDMGRLDGVPF